MRPNVNGFPRISSIMWFIKEPDEKNYSRHYIKNISIAQMSDEELQWLPISGIAALIAIFILKRDHLFGILDICSMYSGIDNKVVLIVVIILGAFGLVLFVRFCLNSYSRYKKWKEEEAVLADLHRRERDALIAFYNATGGPTWKRKDNWCSDFPIHKWKGVHLNHVNGYWVNKLILPDNNLVGQLPGEVFLNLPNLIELDLRENSLTGPIPEEVTSLTKMQGLYLFENQLTSPIPRGLGDLKNLGSLILINNNFDDSDRLDAVASIKARLHPDCYCYI